jgi:hypothetical protein
MPNRSQRSTMDDPLAGSDARCCMISCFVFEQELELIQEKGRRRLPICYLPAEVHSAPQEEAQRMLQAAVDDLDEAPYDAVLLAMGLCQAGIRGLQARRLPLVLPRAHDCIGLLMGSRERYQRFLNESPDSYFLSSGWVVGSRDGAPPMGPRAVEQQLGLGLSPAELEQKYGADNAAFLLEQLQRYRHRHHVYLSTGCCREAELIQEATRTAARTGCRLRVISADTGWLERLASGPWTEDEFLIVPPGRRVSVVYGERLIDLAEEPS